MKEGKVTKMTEHAAWMDNDLGNIGKAPNWMGWGGVGWVARAQTLFST